MTDRPTVLVSSATTPNLFRTPLSLWVVVALLITAFPPSAQGRGSCRAGQVVQQVGNYPVPIVYGGSQPGFLTPAPSYRDAYYHDDVYYIGPPTFQPLIPRDVTPTYPEEYSPTYPSRPIIIIQQAAQAPPPPVARPVGSRRLVPARPEAHRNPNAYTNSTGKPGKLYLWIQQSEALVTLDGDDLGTGADIENMHFPLKLTAGVHVLVTEHPDFGSERLVFSLAAGKAILVEINLSGNRSGRKARIRSGPEIAARLPFLQR